MSVAIAVMTKTAGHSPVKTRLAAGIGAATATKLHRLSADATASVVARAFNRDDVFVYWAIAEPTQAAAAAWADVRAMGIEVIHQSGDSHGERMGRLHTALVARHGAAILVGTDSPQMQAAQLGQAIDWLRSDAPRTVLGPADDGGFWLFGGNRPLPFADWTDIEYGTATTGAAFAATLQPYGERLNLPRLTDLDVAANLDPLREQLCALADPTPAQRALRSVLTQLHTRDRAHA